MFKCEWIFYVLKIFLYNSTGPELNAKIRKIETNENSLTISFGLVSVLDRDFRNHLRSCMWHLNFFSSPADPDVWMRPAKKSDGSEYYEYIVLYTDDTLCISEHPDQVLREELGKYFKLKESSIGFI